jgi:hypothetical protein
MGEGGGDDPWSCVEDEAGRRAKHGSTQPARRWQLRPLGGGRQAC